MGNSTGRFSPAKGARETRAQRKKRLIDEGRWDDFQKRRAELKKTHPDGEADRIANEEFLPVDAGSAPAPTTQSEEGISGDQAGVLNPSDVEDAPSAATSQSREGILEQIGTKKATEVEVIRWVFENMLADVNSLNPEECPSVGAFSLLEQCQVSPDMRRLFYQQIWPKIIPRDTQLDEQTAMIRSDRRIIGNIDMLLELSERLHGDSNT